MGRKKRPTGTSGASIERLAVKVTTIFNIICIQRDDDGKKLGHPELTTIQEELENDVAVIVGSFRLRNLWLNMRLVASIDDLEAKDRSIFNIVYNKAIELENKRKNKSKLS